MLFSFHKTGGDRRSARGCNYQILLLTKYYRPILSIPQSASWISHLDDPAQFFERLLLIRADDVAGSDILAGLFVCKNQIVDVVIVVCGPVPGYDSAREPLPFRMAV